MWHNIATFNVQYFSSTDEELDELSELDGNEPFACFVLDTTREGRHLLSSTSPFQWVLEDSETTVCFGACLKLDQLEQLQTVHLVSSQIGRLSRGLLVEEAKNNLDSLVRTASATGTDARKKIAVRLVAPPTNVHTGESLQMELLSWAGG